jgi:hypothetical protein
MDYHGGRLDISKLKYLGKNDNYDRSAMPLATAGTQEMTVMFLAPQTRIHYALHCNDFISLP